MSKGDVPKLVAKSKRPEAERATEWALVEQCGCVATRRALRTKFAKVDFFAADTIGVRADGTRLWIQVTAGQTGAVLTRRRKLEAYPWHPSDIVQVWQLTSRAEVTNPRKKEWFFRCWDYQLQRGADFGKRIWDDGTSAIPVPTRWFKAFHREDE